MAVEEITIDHTAGAGAAVRISDPSTGKVFDFSTLTFVTLTGGANEKLTLTELAANNKGTGRSTYRATFDVANLYRGLLPKRYVLDFHSGASPASSSVPVSSVDRFVQAGQFSEDPVQIVTTVTPMQAEVFSVQIAVACLVRDTPISMFSGAKTAFTVTPGTDRVNVASHGLSNLDVVCFSTSGTLPAGLTAATPYYVRNVLSGSFQVSLTASGAIVDITDTGTGTHWWDNPTATVAVREVGTVSPTFTKTFKLDAFIGNRFEGRYPDGVAFTFFDGTTVTSVAHGLSHRQPIAFMVDPGGVPHYGLMEGRTYYVDSGAGLPDTFQMTLNNNPNLSAALNGPVGFTLNGSGTFRYFTTRWLMKPGRAYEVVTTLVMSGQTFVRTSSVTMPRAPQYQNSEIEQSRTIDTYSTQLQAISSSVGSLGTVLSVTGVRLANTQPLWPPAKVGEGMTLQTAALDAIQSRVDASAKLSAIFTKLPSRAYLSGSAQATGALEPADLPPPADKTFWNSSTPRVTGLSPGQAYTWELLTDNEAQIYALNNLPNGWIQVADPSLSARYTAGDMALVVTASAGGAVEPVTIPVPAFVDGTKFRLRRRVGASPSLTDPVIGASWRLSRSTAEPVTQLSLNALKQFVNTDTGLTTIASGSVAKLSGGDVVRPATDLILLDTTVQSVVDNRTFVLVGGSNSYDQSFNNSLALLYDVSTGAVPDPGTVKSWDAASRTLQLQRVPAFTVSVGDKVLIMASPGTSYSQTGAYVMR